MGCTSEAITENGTAITNATVSTVAFVAGGVLFVGGVTLYLTAPKEKSPGVGLQVMASFGFPAGLTVAGRF
jgi:hypothetical protein